MSFQPAVQESPLTPHWEGLLNEWEDWDEILGFIEEGRCILMLGPEISICPEKQVPYTHLFTQELKKKLQDVSLTSDDFRTVAEAYIDKYSESLFINKVKRFYRQQQHPGLLNEDISEIPFSLVINTSPDNLLWKCYKNKNALFDFYDYTQNREQPAFSGEPQMPLIYNLFGSALKPDSLVITERDRIEFLVNIIRRNPPLPENIKSEKILNIENMFLFVGFDFNEWYLRLLLKILSLNNTRFAYALEHADRNVQPVNKVFYSSNFNLSFLEAPHSVFLKTLKEKYLERNPALTNVKIRMEPAVENSENKIKYVMISASLRDEPYVLEIEKMISPLIVKKKIRTWHSGKIIPGKTTQDEMDYETGKADIIVLSLSPDSIVHHMNNGVFERIKERLDRGDDLKIIPLLLRPCLYEEIDILEGLVVYPNHEGKVYSVNDGYWSDSAEALKMFVDNLRNLL